MNQPVIVVSGLVKTYPGVTALSGISLEIHAGESVALLGENGAGKTTLFNVLLGLLSPDSGECSVLGVSDLTSHPEIKAQIMFVADHAGPIPWASAFDLSKLYRSLYPHWSQPVFERHMKEWSIDLYRPLRALSKGQKRLAEMALVAGCAPAVLLLDEPFNGLDPVMRLQIQHMLTQMRTERSTTVFYATHILSEVPSIAQRVIILRKGEVCLDSPVADLPGSVEQAFVEHYGLQPA